ncbi:MAG: flagellar export chaperone FliS [Verrucomicrobiia bacterium]
MNQCSPNHPANAYRRVAMQTAPPAQLVLMLYDGTIRFLERALTGFSKDDPVEFHETISNNILRAQEIIRELARSLDLNAGGELARQLDRLYEYFDRRLMESNLNKHEDGIRDVIKRMSTIRNAWAAMLKGEGDQIASTPTQETSAGCALATASIP